MTNNEYLYSVTSTNDNEISPSWIGRYSDALSAVVTFESFTDHGFADEYRTVNLSEPSGKMHTKVLYRSGKVTTK
jgi:hypothetical protein